LTIPFLVMNVRYLPSSKSLIGIIAEIFSSFSSGSRFTIAVPFACLLASGI